MCSAPPPSARTPQAPRKRDLDGLERQIATRQTEEQRIARGGERLEAAGIELEHVFLDKDYLRPEARHHRASLRDVGADDEDLHERAGGRGPMEEVRGRSDEQRGPRPVRMPGV